MASKPTKKLAKRPVGTLSKDQAKVEKAKQEVLQKGSKLRKPITLARRRVVKLTLSILGAVVVAFLLLVAILIYVGKNDSTVVYRVSQIIPYPAAKVNGRFVTYDDYLFEVRYRKNIYANPTGPASASQEPVDFKSEEGQNLLKDIQVSALKRAKTKALVKQMADERGLNVSDDEVTRDIEQLMARQGGRDKFETAIAQYYGWDLGDFEDEYELQLLQQKLQVAIMADASPEQKARAEEALNKAKSGADFVALAKEYSQDTGSKDNGGDLGFVTQDTPYVEEFKQAALKLEPGQVSEIVVSRFGFHIIKATEKGDQGVKVSHILIEFGKDIETLLNEELEKANTSDYIKVAPAPKPEQPEQPETEPAPAQ